MFIIIIIIIIMTIARRNMQQDIHTDSRLEESNGVSE